MHIFFLNVAFYFIFFVAPITGKIHFILTQALKYLLLPDSDIFLLLLAVGFECEDFTALISVQLPLICIGETEK